MSIVETFLTMIVVSEEYILLLTVLPLIVISILLFHYYTSSNTNIHANKRTHDHSKSHALLALAKYI